VTTDDAFMTHVQRTVFEYDYSDEASWWIEQDASQERDRRARSLQARTLARCSGQRSQDGREHIPVARAHQTCPLFKER
jgi:hypothetical protein